MNLSSLDQEECFNLALHAMQRQQHHEAILLLKHAQTLAPTDARLRYLLGAEYAQIGLFERALTLMEQALRQDPALEMASLQLGLLYLTLGRVEQALQTWQDAVPRMQSEPLRLFCTGLQHLARDEFPACRALFQQGMAANQTQPVLNEDMQKILDRLPTEVHSTTEQAAESEPTPDTESNNSALFIRAYTTADKDTFH